MDNFLSTEEKLERIQRQFPLWMGVAVKAVLDHYGNEGVRVIGDALYKHGSAQGQRVALKRMKGKPDWGIPDIVQEMQTLITVMGFSPDDMEVVELSPGRGALRFHRCPYISPWKMAEAPPNMCEIWGNWAHAFYRAFNPKFDFTILRSMQRGDDYCEEVWEIKEAVES